MLQGSDLFLIIGKSYRTIIGGGTSTSTSAPGTKAGLGTK